MSRDVFDRIASGWYNYRHWTIFRTELEMLAERWQSGSLLNIGCAHGPDFLPFKDSFRLHGLDYSRRMLEHAVKYADKFEYTVNLITGDARQLPLYDNSFDYAISVATYHHIDNREGRVAALKELKRVLKPDGEAFITVWNRWQPKFWFKSKEPDVPWRSKEETLHRYYYLFTYPEISKLVKHAGLQILKMFPESGYRFPVKYFSRNICLHVRKTG